MLTFKEEKTMTLSARDILEIGVVYGSAIRDGASETSAKIAAIKAIREKTGCNLRTAKDVAEVYFFL